MIQPGLISTSFTVEGHRIVEQRGIVRGISVRSRSIIGNLGASLQQIVGGNITILRDLCEKTRLDALLMMAQHAEQMGANAVIGVRYDANEIMQGVAEVICYGTAAVVVPLTQPPPMP